ANKEPNRSVVRAAVRTTRQNSRTKEPITRKPPVKPISSAIPEKRKSLCAAAVLLVGVVAVDLTEYAAKIDQYAKANPQSKDPVRAIRGQHEAEAWFFLLKDYQRERILSFVAPEVIDPKGLGVTWNVNQAVIAVGRGGFRGQGVGNGTQARFGYLPEAAAHNDFLFSGMAEEIGFTGGYRRFPGDRFLRPAVLARRAHGGADDGSVRLFVGDRRGGRARHARRDQRRHEHRPDARHRGPPSFP
ncbi:MAG: hypothetical protein RLZ70_1998, partial [Verrucomicrobiota bacterium]